jgi:hypothetical protein
MLPFIQPCIGQAFCPLPPQPHFSSSDLSLPALPLVAATAELDALGALEAVELALEALGSGALASGSLVALVEAAGSPVSLAEGVASELGRGSAVGVVPEAPPSQARKPLSTRLATSKRRVAEGGMIARFVIAADSVRKRPR